MAIPQIALPACFPPRRMSRLLLLLGLPMVLSWMAGCRNQDEITQYTVARREVHPPKLKRSDSEQGPGVRARPAVGDSSEEEGQDRLLGAIAPRGATTWFFKLTGPSRLVGEEQATGFLKFLASLGFSDRGPEWSLPEGWREEPGSGMRYATLLIPTDESPLEMSAISLPSGEGDVETYVLSNVNRWRGQMGLGALEQGDLEKGASKLHRKDGDIWLVEMLGRLSGQGMGTRPFAGRRGRGESEAPAPSADRAASLPFTSQLPEGWKQVRAGQMQIALYEVRDGSRQASISVSSAGGELSANVNRWRGQIGLAPLDAAELAAQSRTIDIEGHEGKIVELVGPEGAEPRESILGAIVTVRGTQWFFKLKGDADLAVREKEHFEAFLKSIKFQGD
jgi:hypothetical protein